MWPSKSERKNSNIECFIPVPTFAIFCLQILQLLRLDLAYSQAKSVNGSGFGALAADDFFFDALDELFEAFFDVEPPDDASSPPPPDILFLSSVWSSHRSLLKPSIRVTNYYLIAEGFLFDTSHIWECMEAFNLQWDNVLMFSYLFIYASLLRVTHFSDKHCFPGWPSFTWYNIQYINSWTKLLHI